VARRGLRSVRIGSLAAFQPTSLRSSERCQRDIEENYCSYTDYFFWLLNFSKKNTFVVEIVFSTLKKNDKNFSEICFLIFFVENFSKKFCRLELMILFIIISILSILFYNNI
jgi:hypothetical protein